MAKNAKTLKKLTGKQLAYVEAFLADPDMSPRAAAIKAGYSANEHTLKEMVKRLQVHPLVQAEIAERLKERKKRHEVTADRVIQQLANAAFGDVSEVLDYGPGGIKLKELKELPKEVRAMIQSATQTETANGTNVSVKLCDKMKALELLGRNLKLFTDKLDVGGEVKQKIEIVDFSNLPEDEDDTGE